MDELIRDLAALVRACKVLVAPPGDRDGTEEYAMNVLHNMILDTIDVIKEKAASLYTYSG